MTLPNSSPIRGHITRSFLRLIIRDSIRPKLTSSPFGNRSCRKGIETSIDQPSSSITVSLRNTASPRKTVQGNAFVRDGSVILRAECIDLEEIRVAAVAVGVETNVGVVVAVIAPSTLQVLGPDQFPAPRRRT